MEIEITQLILKYGLPFITMAFIVMSLVGVVKIFTKGIVVKKNVSEKAAKWFAKLYLALALIFSYGASLIYYTCILKQNCWTIACVRDAGIVWTITSPLYQIYKQFGGRKLLVWFVGLFKGKNSDTDSLIEIIEKILDEEAPLLTDAQKDAINDKLANEITNNKNKE